MPFLALTASSHSSASVALVYAALLDAESWPSWSPQPEADITSRTAHSGLGDLAKSGDEECTTTTHATSGTGILDVLKQVKSIAAACDKTPSVPKDLISDARHYYDGTNSPDTPATKGDVTRLDEHDAKGTGYRPGQLTRTDSTLRARAFLRPHGCPPPGRPVADLDRSGHRHYRPAQPPALRPAPRMRP
ncbi:hypothetical protein ABZY14_39970 [Streptomyces sp. NPDC006617]|uniref:hypothetical protein n=1 Tax=Streptomyces sp. NPDC006617 TaxID=3155354 RepID=UPI0033A0EA46